MLNMLQTISLACILCIVFISISVFVQNAESHGNQHEYSVTADVIEVTTCGGCGASVGYYWIGTTTITQWHASGDAHATVYYYTDDDYCGSCGSA